MDKDKLKIFCRHLSRQTDRDYLFSLLAFGASANLVGLKPASLLLLPQGARPLVDVWDKFKGEVAGRLNLEYRELRRSSGGILVFLFRRHLLEDCLRDGAKRRFLRERGFGDDQGLDARLTELERRFSEACPDEVGLFLGYSLGDVRGFIRNGGGGGLFCRYWRVYERAGKARRHFENIDRSRNWVMDRILRDQSPDFSRPDPFYPWRGEKIPSGSILCAQS